ncbi:MAG: histone deacetylase family protein [Thiolinea sp.]
MTTAIISHTQCGLHDNGSAWHPESPQRLSAISDRLISSGVDWIVRHYDAPAADKAQLHMAHSAHYVDEVFAKSPAAGERAMLDSDTGMNEHSLQAALHAAGAAIMAVDLVLSGEHSSAFCIVRPPGHHAGRANSGGFCIFNNIALAALQALEQHGLERVAIIDFDVHHGDGTQNIVGNDPRILFCSSFQHPYDPFSGADNNPDNVLNLPLPAGTAGAAWREAVEQSWLPALDAFKPQLILISAGFDSHLEDDMGGLSLVESDYVWITRQLAKLAEQHAQGRIVSCLEGGYDLSSLGRSVAAHVKALTE